MQRAWGPPPSALGPPAISPGANIITRGQWPYIPAATRAMRNGHVMLYDITRPWRSFDLKFEISNLDHTGFILPPTASEAMLASKQLWKSYDLRFEISNLEYPGIHPCAYCFQWPPNNLGGHMTSDLTSATLITLVSMCILPLTAILVSSEAMATSR